MSRTEYIVVCGQPTGMEEPYQAQIVVDGYQKLAGSKTVAGVFAQTHSNEAAVQACIVNQARDATVLDG